MKRVKKLYGVLTLASGAAFVDRYTEAERKTISRTGLELAIGTDRRIRYFAEKVDAYSYAERHVHEQVRSLNTEVDFLKACLKRLKADTK